MFVLIFSLWGLNPFLLYFYHASPYKLSTTSREFSSSGLRLIHIEGKNNVNEKEETTHEHLTFFCFGHYLRSVQEQVILPDAIVGRSRLALHARESGGPPFVGELAPGGSVVLLGIGSGAHLLLINKVQLHVAAFVVPTVHELVEDDGTITRATVGDDVSGVGAGRGWGHEDGGNVRAVVERKPRVAVDLGSILLSLCAGILGALALVAEAGVQVDHGLGEGVGIVSHNAGGVSLGREARSHCGGALLLIFLLELVHDNFGGLAAFPHVGKGAEEGLAGFGGKVITRLNRVLCGVPWSVVNNGSDDRASHYL